MRTGKIIKINKGVTSLAGYTKKDLVGKRLPALKMFTPQSLVKIIAAFAKRVSGQQVPPYEVEVRTKKGKKMFMELHGSHLKVDGKVVGEVAVLRDITERKELGQKLETSNRTLRLKTREMAQNIAQLAEANQELVEKDRKIIELEGKMRELIEKK